MFEIYHLPNIRCKKYLKSLGFYQLPDKLKLLCWNGLGSVVRIITLLLSHMRVFFTEKLLCRNTPKTQNVTYLISILNGYVFLKCVYILWQRELSISDTLFFHTEGIKVALIKTQKNVKAFHLTMKAKKNKILSKNENNFWIHTSPLDTVPCMIQAPTDKLLRVMSPYLLILLIVRMVESIHSLTKLKRSNDSILTFIIQQSHN